jgi:cytoskeletal protein CcmA (bactofilin family)
MGLFGRQKKEDKSKQPHTELAQNETTYFGKNLMIKGRVSGNGNIIILGGLDGEFNLKGQIKIAQPANIKGEVKADVISVNGSVQGSLIAQQRVHLDQTARIEGQIITPSLSITEGAFFDGEIKMGGRSPNVSKSAADGGSASVQSPAKSSATSAGRRDAGDDKLAKANTGTNNGVKSTRS